MILVKPLSSCGMRRIWRSDNFVARLERASSTDNEMDKAKALLAAIEAEDVESVRSALQNGANANYVDEDDSMLMRQPRDY